MVLINILKWASLIVAAIILLISLLQEDITEGILSLGANSSNLALFKNSKTRGIDKFLEVFTYILVFIVFGILIFATKL